MNIHTIWMRLSYSGRARKPHMDHWTWVFLIDSRVGGWFYKASKTVSLEQQPCNWLGLT